MIRSCSLYLGNGLDINNSGYSIKSSSFDGSANLVIHVVEMYTSLNQRIELATPDGAKNKITFINVNNKTELKFTKSGNQTKFEVPVVSSGTLRIE